MLAQKKLLFDNLKLILQRNRIDIAKSSIFNGDIVCMYSVYFGDLAIGVLRMYELSQEDNVTENVDKDKFRAILNNKFENSKDVFYFLIKYFIFRSFFLIFR